MNECVRISLLEKYILENKKYSIGLDEKKNMDWPISWYQMMLVLKNINAPSTYKHYLMAFITAAIRP